MTVVSLRSTAAGELGVEAVEKTQIWNYELFESIRESGTQYMIETVFIDEKHAYIVLCELLNEHC